MLNKNSCTIVLCRAQNSANIGSAARASSVMGFESMVLVDPQCDPFDEQAIKLACHARSVLDSARCYASLQELVSSEHFLVGFSVRPRTLGPNTVDLPNLVTQLGHLDKAEVFFVFGSERTGLSNEELSYCNLQCFIPTFHASYSSLNLAQAVQLVTYTLALALGDRKAVDDPSLNRKQAPSTMEKALGAYLEQLVNTPALKAFQERTTVDTTLLRLRLLTKKILANEDELKFFFGFLKALARDRELP